GRPPPGRTRPWGGGVRARVRGPSPLGDVPYRVGGAAPGRRTDTGWHHRRCARPSSRPLVAQPLSYSGARRRGRGDRALRLRLPHPPRARGARRGALRGRVAPRRRRRGLRPPRALAARASAGLAGVPGGPRAPAPLRARIDACHGARGSRIGTSAMSRGALAAAYRRTVPPPPRILPLPESSREPGYARIALTTRRPRAYSPAHDDPHRARGRSRPRRERPGASRG